jgi:hypothetical protein
MQLPFIMTIIELVIKYGIPGVVAIMAAWKIDKEEVTQADIAFLRSMKPPEDFFK